MTHQIKKYTVQDYRQLEEGAPYELINGTLVHKYDAGEPSPSYQHQDVSGEIFGQIWSHLKKTHSGKVLSAPLDVFFDRENAFQPDIIFIDGDNKDLIGEDGKIYGAPDLIIEVLSPSSAYLDLKKKKEIYEKYGVKEYWIADPHDHEVIGYTLQNNRYAETFRGQNTFYSSILNLTITLQS